MKVSLNRRIIALVVGIVLVAIASTAGVSIVISRDLAKKQALSLTYEVASKNAAAVKSGMNSAFAVARTIAQTLFSMKNGKAPDRNLMNDVLRTYLDKNKGLLGTWTAWEPNALDGDDANWTGKRGHDATGRFIPYWYRADGKIDVEPLASYDVPGDGDYYLLSRDSGEETLLEPYIYSVGGKDTLITSLVAPILSNGKGIGVGGVDIALSDIQVSLGRIRPFETGYVTLVSNTGIIVAHPDKDMVGKGISSAGFGDQYKQAIKSGNVQEVQDLTVGGEDVIQIIEALSLGQAKTPWALIVTVPKAKILESTDTLISSILTISVILAAISVVVAFFVARAISRPISAMTDAMKSLADGNVSITIPALERADEIGEMAKAVEVFRGNAQRVSEMEKEQEERRVARAREEHQKQEKLAQEFQTSVGAVIADISKATEEMLQQANDMKSVSSNTQNKVVLGVESANAASGSVTSVSSATEELHAAVSGIGQQVTRSSEIAGQAVTDARETNDKVQGLAQAVEKIDEVVSLINDIAEQTNLLALNATIEAARAGDFGKGFAVVASEVKKLANQTALATDNIASQIAEVNKATASSVNAIEGIVGTIGNIDDISTSIAAAVEQQGAATQEIARSAEQASRGTQEVSESMGEIKEFSARSDTASNQLEDSARSVAEKIRNLQADVDKFIGEIRNT